MKKYTLAIFGCTGSIGKSALKVYEKNKDKFDLIYLSAHKNYKKLEKLKKKYKPRHILLTSKKTNKKSDIFKLSKIKKIDFVISGVAGYSALELNFKLLKITNNLLLANKETIICGGSFFLSQAKKNDCNIIPIDSEHHCIDFFLKSFSLHNQVKNFYLTASGGPFLKKKINYNEKIKNVIRHPNWKMGKKISIDSSTFANKVLELFEAKILFGINPNKISILVEEKSNVHAIIELNNNFIIPIIHAANMEIAIANSLNLSNNYKVSLDNLKINLIKPNITKFPIIKLGFEILRKYNHSGMIVFTILNERLVNLYLDRKIKYGDIPVNLVKAFRKKNIINMSKKKITNMYDINKIMLKASNVKI